ncbi:sterol desaturase family protein [uncultured Polaribacter sp.]|uniref:sterol desaturase family protein n=1 Tax=uncultured Polaribacter sp. TaxID=174711 RepID=UPI0026222E05|nr:sterol desaturase family protein [uncultured Polaribacter sp.]
MENFLNFFETMPSWQKLLWIFICISANWIVELIIPLVKFDYKKWKHAGVNMVFLAMDVSLNLIFGVLSVGIFVWLSTNNFGVLNMIDLPIWVELLIAIAALDFSAQYLVHYLLHKVPFMWRFHMIHHSDTTVDATSATRHHPGDYAFREIFALIVIIIFGVPLAYYLFYRMATVFFSYFTHANFYMPKKLDKIISYIFVTPNMHKFHHHHVMPWTDTNFGNIFSIWDRMFGTLTYDDPKKVKFGLDLLDDSRDQDILYQLKVPFNKNIKLKTDK